VGLARQPCAGGAPRACPPAGSREGTCVATTARTKTTAAGCCNKPLSRGTVPTESKCSSIAATVTAGGNQCFDKPRPKISIAADCTTNCKRRRPGCARGSSARTRLQHAYVRVTTTPACSRAATIFQNCRADAANPAARHQGALRERSHASAHREELLERHRHDRGFQLIDCADDATRETPRGSVPAGLARGPFALLGPVHRINNIV